MTYTSSYQNGRTACIATDGWFTKHILRLALIGLLLLLSSGVVRAQAPKESEFGELSTCAVPVQKFVLGTTVLGSDPSAEIAPEPVPFPFAANAPLLASEGNTNFVHACGDLSLALTAMRAAAVPRQASWIRRVVSLNPGVVVVDDMVLGWSGNVSLTWAPGTNGCSQVMPRQWRVQHGSEELVCETVWPLSAGKADHISSATSLKSSPILREYRQIQVLSVGSHAVDRPDTFWSRSLAALGWTKESGRPRTKAVETERGTVQLTISTPNRVFQLELPRPGSATGWIRIADTEGGVLVHRRPLARGNLPPGDLVDQWDSQFRSHRAAEWDKGGPARKLQSVVEQGEIKPCRVVDLGCGTGNDAIYLAQRGFEVTAVDIAPTGLQFAADKAKEAGVRVNWVLADVLNLPELGKFDFIFDRGCYHNVRHVDAARFSASLRQLSRSGSKCLILSLNGEKAPGVREEHMRQDFADGFLIERLEPGGIEDRAGNVFDSWALTLRRNSNDDSRTAQRRADSGSRALESQTREP